MANKRRFEAEPLVSSGSEFDGPMKVFSSIEDTLDESGPSTKAKKRCVSPVYGEVSLTISSFSKISWHSSSVKGFFTRSRNSHG